MHTSVEMRSRGENVENVNQERRWEW